VVSGARAVGLPGGKGAEVLDGEADWRRGGARVES
jgi:hypothetical protein